MCEVFGRIILWLFRFVSFSNWIEVLKLVGAAAAFWIGLRQYTKAQVWKRLEFVGAEMRVFFDDVAVRSALTMLDWRRKKIALFKYRDEDDRRQKVDVDYETVASALGIDSRAQYSKVQSAIREVFERLLEFLARFEGFIEVDAVKPSDLNPYLDYWVRLLSGNDPHSPDVTKKVLPQLWTFIDYYGYSDVRRFVSRYNNVTFAEYVERSARN
jgi:hypothetical protein